MDPTTSKRCHPQRAAVGDFLVAQRAAITPAAAGLPMVGYRRTPGLRREEVAMLAGIGVSWYTCIEQGKAGRLSRDILDSIAAALRLTPAEHRYLRRLARAAGESVPPASVPDPHALRQLVDGWTPNPAYIIDRQWTILEINDCACELFGLDTGHNVVREFFLGDTARARHPRWDRDAASLVARFRSHTPECLGDREFTSMISGLCVRSAEFAGLWARHEVTDDSSGCEVVHHERTGEVRLTRIGLDVPSESGLRMVVFLPAPGTAAAFVLERLHSARSRSPGAHAIVRSA